MKQLKTKSDVWELLSASTASAAPDTAIKTGLLWLLAEKASEQESWMHLALDERERSAGVHNLALYIREPGSAWAAQGQVEPRDYVEKMRRDPTRARDFTRVLFEVHPSLGYKLAEMLDLTGVQRLMDAGGGSGVVSMALLRKHPGLIATVVDKEPSNHVHRRL